ncbi:glycosyltransferase family 2 protein [Plantactinospora sp. GCM10030261]|uniref:glycosyltransferase family 2 protein n=1 Tax=Plantactinospora sp. GCM10030261 TaxID=3273420 RepID=UPI00360BD6B1
MPLLSLIIPVYRVEDFLAECLDSVLGQSFRDIEVIAVDDASDDGSAAILTRYAARDPRITVVTLTRNGGLGHARNVGITRATGRYVWCVDSDDWLPPGTLRAVADRLAQTEPDLLVTGYTRVHPDGRVESHDLGRVGRGDPVPGVFRFADRPGLLDVLWIACNKVIRRDFLTTSGLAFGPGWYEDVAFVLPLMIAAERISLLDRNCYAYRQRPAGAITWTVSDRHFEVFEQWDRVMAYLAAHPERAATLRPLIFRKMIWHCLQVLGHASRVPRAQRRRYFQRLAERYHRHRPAVAPPMPGGNEGIKQRLVAVDGYLLFEMMMTGWQARRRLLGRVRPTCMPPAAGAVPADGAAVPTSGRSAIRTG